MVIHAFCPQESFRFIEQATSIMKAIGSVLNNFGNWPDLSRAMRGLELTHCPPGLCGRGIAREHFKVKKQVPDFSVKL